MVLSCIYMITLLADKFDYKGSRLDELIGKLSNQKIRTIIEIVVVAIASLTFIVTTIYLIDFSIYLFCHHKIADFCFDRIYYTLIIFFIVLLIAIIPELHIFGYVNMFSIVFLLGTGWFISYALNTLCVTLCNIS